MKEEIELAETVIKWWEENQFNVAGDFNVYDDKPFFVIKAEEILKQYRFNKTDKMKQDIDYRTLDISIRFWIPKDSINKIEDITNKIFYKENILIEGDFRIVGKKTDCEIIFRGAGKYLSKEQVIKDMHILIEQLTSYKFDIAHAIAYSNNKNNNEIIYSLLNGEI